MRTTYSPRIEIPRAFSAPKKLPTRIYEVQPGMAQSVKSLQKSEKPLAARKTAKAAAPIAWKIAKGRVEKENMAVFARRSRPQSDTRGFAS